MAECLRCGIDVARYGIVCKDCISVDFKLSNQLRAEAQVKIQKQKDKDALLSGLVYVGTTAKEQQRKRDRNRKR